MHHHFIREKVLKGDVNLLPEYKRMNAVYICLEVLKISMASWHHQHGVGAEGEYIIVITNSRFRLMISSSNILHVLD